MLASDTDRIWKVGYVSGAFDMFHIGHLNLIRRASERSDRLIVGVLTDEVVDGIKKKWPVIPLRERMEIVRAVKYVDEVDATTQSLLNKIKAWEKYRFDAMFSGDDHINDGWAKEEDELKALGVDLVFFPYTKEVSSELLQSETLPPKAENADKARRIGEFTHLFPFDKIEKGERIVVYGTGIVGEQYARQLEALDFCELAAFADTYAEKNTEFLEKPLYAPEELLLNSDKYDRVVIASTKYHDQIISRLRALEIQPWRVV